MKFIVRKKNIFRKKKYIFYFRKKNIKIKYKKTS